MEKRSQGQIRTHDRKDGLTTYSLRVRAYGRREVVTLGTDGDGWTMRKAERKLGQVLAEIQVGVWRPPSMSAGGEDPTFDEFASRWWIARKSELRPTTQADYEWRLGKHLLPFFHAYRVSAITIALVDEYRSEKVGHADSKTTLEIYAQVQKRVSRKNVHAAFDRLLNGADNDVASAGV